ncbi:MAG: winged helix-turn-helix domain-containing protein [Myxococcales bacterium]|nr:winged helix-turn-helix domain-containing protein [Myxococcales bacterium]
MPLRVMLVDVPEGDRDGLQRALWREAYRLDWLRAADVSVHLADRPADVALVTALDAPVVEEIRAGAPGMPLLQVGEPQAMVAQLQVLFPPEVALSLSGAEVRLDQAVAVRSGERLRLTSNEVRLLTFLAAHPGDVVHEEELLTKVWGYHPRTRSRAVASTVYRLRRKIEVDPAEPRSLLSFYGEGYQLVLGEGQASPTPTVGDVAASRNRFVGRGEQLAGVRGALDDSRVITVVGPGGVGKSRLAQELALCEGERFGGGAWWVDLTDAQGVDDVTLRVGASLGLPLRRERAVSQIEAELRTRGRTLLVLDNCEDAVAAAADVVDAWTRRVGALTVLATSRVPLRIRGERRVVLDPLPVPEVATVAALQASPAVALLRERAAESGALLSLDEPDRAEALRCLAAATDGLPLVIELAASQLGVLPLGEVLANLQTAPLALRSEDRDRPDRHDSLGAALARSWSLLTPEQQELLVHLSVFEGSFTTAAVRAVLPSAAHGLPELVTQSMVQRISMERYRLLRTVQQFVRAQVVPTALREASDAMLAYLLAVEPDRLELQNALAATRWAVSQGRGDAAAAVLLRYEEILKRLGSLAVGTQLARQVLSLPAPISSGAEAQLRALVALAELGAGRVEEAERCLEGVPPSRVPRVVARVEHARALVAGAHGKIPTVALHLAEAVQAAREVDEAFLAVVLADWGNVLANTGRAEEGLQALREAEQVARRRVGNLPYVLHLLGVWYARQGRNDEAKDVFEQGLRAALAEGNHHAAAHLTNALAVQARGRGQLDRAVALYDEAADRFARVGEAAGVAVALVNEGNVEAQRGHPVRARDLLEAGVVAARESGRLGRLSYALGSLGCHHRERGRHAAALACFEEGLELIRSNMEANRALAEMLARRAWLFADMGRHDEARRELAEARAIADRLGFAATSPSVRTMDKAQVALDVAGSDQTR